MIALRHPVEHHRGGRQSELDLDSAVHVPAPNLEARVSEHVQHGGVLGENLRDKPIDADGTGVRGQAFEQAARDATSLKLVGDHEGDFGARPVAEPDPGPDPDHAHGAVLADQFADQGQAFVAVALEK